MNKPTQTTRLHPRNPHQGRYDFVQLTKALPQLKQATILNPNDEPTIDFTNPQSVLLLNKALLKQHYHIHYWDIPASYLCPPIPSRADYVHHLADLLALHMQDKQIPTGKQVRVLDIGTGANAIYPIIGSQAYGWRFTATDIDPISIKTVQALTQCNLPLKGHIKAVLQHNPQHIFAGIVKADDYFDACMCNPPFHASAQEATKANINKQNKLAFNKAKHAKTAKTKAVNLNFGGQNGELWCEGGEVAFLKKMIKESKTYAQNFGWFTSLVSKKDNLKPLTALLSKLKAQEVKVINMQHGQKQTRILAWHF